MSSLPRWLSIVIVAVILLALLGFVIAFKNSSFNTNTSEYIMQDYNTNVEFTSDELVGEYTNYDVKINLDEMSIASGTGVNISETTIKITRAGVYYFTGTAKEGNIIVEADNQEVVLVFDNANITCSTTSVVNVIDAKKVTINIPEGSMSTFTDSTEYTLFTEDDEPNATVFSKDDMTIDGKGTLTIVANYQDAIASKDGLKIAGTTLNITSADDGIRGKDYVAIKDANITVKSKGKSIKATEETDTSLGYILIENGNFNLESEDDAIHSNNKVIINNGTFEINASDDGIHADSIIYINDGTVNITKSYEGIEANYIEINGGNISVVASDDGINVNGGNDTMGMFKQDSFKTVESDDGRVLVINGGNIKVESNGDGLDSNGSIKITGGTTIVGGSTNGGNSALDFDRELTISGGTLIAYGPTGMWQNPSSSSTQYSITFETTGKANDKIELRDSSGNVIAEFTANRAYGIVCISTDKLEKGEKYTLYINDTEIATQEITSIVTSNGTSQGGFMGGGRGQRDGFQMMSGDNMQFPMRNNDGQQGEIPDGEPPEGMPSGNGFRGGKNKRDKMQENQDNV